MIPELAAWFIFLLPLGSFVLIAFLIRPFLNRYSWLAAPATIVAVAGSLALSLWALSSVIDDASAFEKWEPHPWLKVADLDITIGILMDPLTAIMVVVVTSVSLMIQVYSVGYMRGDAGYARFYAYMSLFTASMLGLVLARNIIQLYVFWELVGLCSYLLIGFWYHKPAAAAAAKKAFIVTRIGDFGFLLGILYLFLHTDSFQAGQNVLDIVDINRAAAGGLIAGGVVTWIAVGIFSGAVGKSGQFPLHTWLPDAMEGPTPVSALIHAATMVTAGVFLVARFFPVFEASQVAMNTVAIIGGVTAVFAASMGLVMNDIKRVLAYSTISQLGFMMLALGVGAYGAAIFHLFTHAFFKALLFLGSGNVSHATDTFDMRYMGGLRRIMPLTYAAFLIGALSLAGVFPMAGFWSKDEILAHAWSGDSAVSQLVFWLALLAVFMTAFYMFRALFMTFEGKFKGGGEADGAPQAQGHGVHLAESPLLMVGPVLLLAAAALAIGFIANPVTDLGVIPIHWLSKFLGVVPEEFNVPIAAASSAVAVAGIGLAFVMYVRRPDLAEKMGQRFGPAYLVLSRKYYLDELYENVLTIHFFYDRVANVTDWIDKYIVDGIVRLIDKIGRNIGRAIALLQTGHLQGYGVAFSIGVLVIFGIYAFWR